MADFLDVKRKEIDERLRELRPLVDEYNRLEAASAALSGVGNSGTRRPAARAASSPKPRSRRSSGSSKGSPTGRKRGRPRGTGQRAIQALKVVRARPGITIPELADAMGIKQNYLYRVLPTLEAEGKVVKQAKGWHPA